MSIINFQKFYVNNKNIYIYTGNASDNDNITVEDNSEPQ